MGFTFVLAVVLLFRLYHGRGFIELGSDDLTLTIPALMRGPIRVPRTTVAAVDGGQAEGPLAAPIPAVTRTPPPPNLTVLFTSVIHLPKGEYSGKGIVPDFTAWKSAGRPVAGIRLRMRDSVDAGRRLKEWLQEERKPVQFVPGATAPGLLDASTFARQRVWKIREAKLMLALWVALAVYFISQSGHHPRAIGIQIAVTLLSGFGMWVALRYAAVVRQSKWSFALLAVFFVLTAWLPSHTPRPVSLGVLLGGLLGIVLIGLEVSRRPPVGKGS